MKKIITSLSYVSLIMCLLSVSSCNEENEGSVDRGSIGGIVTDVNGVKLSGVTIALNPGGKTTETESDGSYFFYNFETGDYTLTATLKDYDTFEKEVKIEADKTITENIKLTNPDIKLTNGSITGTVTDKDGEVLKGVTLGFLENNTTFKLNNEGIYEYYIEAGEYTLYAKLDGYYPYMKTITIELGKELSENIVLEKDTDRTYKANFNNLLEEEESEYVGYINPNAGEYDYTESTFTDKDGKLVFNHYTIGDGTYFGAGFTYTNKTDVETKDYTNSSAITAKGYSGDTYLTCNSNSYTPAVIKLKENGRIKGFYITNSTYAYLTMKEGNSFGKETPFEKGDYFKVIITGKLKGEKTAFVEYYLAKDDNILNKWEWVDLTLLGIVDEVNFDFDSSDKGDWGINTPTYFCLDEIILGISEE